MKEVDVMILECKKGGAPFVSSGIACTLSFCSGEPPTMIRGREYNYKS
jgi:hypothetical protein